MKKIVPVLIVLTLSVFSILPQFKSGYFPMHDDTQVARVIEMGRSLSGWQFPVRWVSDLGYGYGYPIFNFYGPLPYYFGGALYALGLPALLATKLMFAVGTVAPALVLYSVVSGLVGWQAGLISSLLYLFSPYHAVQVYVRGAVGEYWTLLFWPLLIYGFVQTKSVKDASSRWMIGAVGLAGAIVSHTLMGYVTTLLLALCLGVYWIVRFVLRKIDKRLLVRHLKIGLFGIGLTAFFWLPAVLEMGYTSVAGQVSQSANFREHFVCLSQLWSSMWGFAGSAPGCIDGMAMTLGKVHIILAAAGLLGWFMIRPKEKSVFVMLGTVLTLTGVFFATEYSRFLWDLLPGFAYVQYPWRFLAVANLGLALMGGSTVLLAPRQIGRTVLALIFASAVVWMNAKWFVPQYTYTKSSSEFESPSDIRWRVSKISDEYLPDYVPRPKEESQVVFDTIPAQSGFVITPLFTTATDERFVIAATMGGTLTIHKANFPGWRYFINKKEVTPVMADGLPTLNLEQGQSTVTMQFTDTWPRRVGNLISLVALALLGVVSL